jgi:hypothetical protein
VPVVLASMPSSSITPHPGPPPHGGREIRVPDSRPQGGREMRGRDAFPQGESERLISVAEAGRVLDANGVRVSVPSIPLEGAASTVDNAISTVERSITPLPDPPPQGGRVIVPEPPTLPHIVGGL